jgi:LPXTG-motif cell wall-anchored protein
LFMIERLVMRPSFIRAGVVFTTIATAGAVSLASSAQALPTFYPDLVGEALSNTAVPDVTGTVPSGVCSGIFIIRGAAGAGATGSVSFPGQASGTLNLSAGQTVVLKTGTSANGVTGGIGGFAAGGNGLTVTTFPGYGGGAASGFLLDGAVIAVGAGGGGSGNSRQGDGPGGAGGGGTNGVGENGTILYPSGETALGGATGALTSSAGQDALTVYRTMGGSNDYGGGGGGGGWNGGQGGTAGASGGGGSNFILSSAPGMYISGNVSYGSVASGYTGIQYAACPAPSAISAVTVTPNGTSAALSFPAAVDNGTPVTGYQYSLNNGTSWNTLTTAGSSTMTATISSLSLSTAYTVQVRPVYVTADIVANATTSTPAGPGRGVTEYVSATSQSFTTLAQNAVLAKTGSSKSFAPLAGALAALAAGASLMIVRRKNESF